MNFTSKLRDILRTKNISIYKLTHDIGIAENSINNWEKKGSLPNIETLRKICEYLSVSANYLLDLPEDGLNTTEENIIKSYRKLTTINKGKLEGYLNALNEKDSTHDTEDQRFIQLSNCITYKR